MNELIILINVAPQSRETISDLTHTSVNKSIRLLCICKPGYKNISSNQMAPLSRYRTAV